MEAQLIQEALNDLNRLVLEGKALEAFDHYYHDDVVMQENENIPTQGKAANRKREVEFYSAVKEFRGATVKKIAIGENLSMAEWHYDYTHKDWGVRNYTQISVQQWKDGKIIHEKFYYAN